MKRLTITEREKKTKRREYSPRILTLIGLIEKKKHLSLLLIFKLKN